MNDLYIAEDLDLKYGFVLLLNPLGSPIHYAMSLQ